MATSYNGWPASPDKAEIGVVSSDVFPGGAKAGDVTIVLGYVARQLNARVEPCIDGWNWGYTYKANVNNPSQLSCHASGTAIDWNAPDHPNGSSGTFTSAQRGTIYQILDEVQGAVSWLEGYDEMHFEICVNAADLAYVAAILGDAAPPEPTDWWDELSDDEKTQLLADVAQIKDTLARFHPRAVHWGDGTNHYYSFGDGTYIQVPDPMGDGGVHADFRTNLEQSGVDLVEWAGPGAPLADPYRFGNRIPWSDRP